MFITNTQKRVKFMRVQGLKDLKQKTNLNVDLQKVEIFKKVFNLLLQEKTAKEIATECELSLESITNLLQDQTFVKNFVSMKKDLAKVEVSALGYDRLLSILKSGTDKDAIQAFSKLTEATGIVDKSTKLNQQFNFYDKA